MTPYKTKMFREIGAKLAPLIWEGIFDWDKRYDEIYISRFARNHNLNRTHLKDTLGAIMVEIVHRANMLKDENAHEVYDIAKRQVLGMLINAEKNKGRYVGIKKKMAD